MKSYFIRYLGYGRRCKKRPTTSLLALSEDPTPWLLPAHLRLIRRELARREVQS